MDGGWLHLWRLFGILLLPKPMFMAQSNTSLLLRQLRGQIGKQIVVKQYGKKTVVTAYPDMSRVKPSKLQKKGRSKFAEDGVYAQAINNDPVKKAAYKKKVKKGKTVYHSAIQEYLKQA
jgi:hypothetical protein